MKILSGAGISNLMRGSLRVPFVFVRSLLHTTYRCSVGSEDHKK